MAAISANLLAATATPVNGPTGTSTTAARTGFAELLSGITSTTDPTSLVDTLEGLVENADTTETADTTEGAAVLAAVGLIVQQPLPADVIATPPTTDTTAAVVDMAATTLPPGETSDPTPAASRTEQLRFESAPAARNPTRPNLLPADTLATPPATIAEPSARATGLQPAPQFTPNTVVPTTPADAAAAASRTPAVVPQTPLVAGLGQLPATLPEVGYGLIGPTVVGTPAVQGVPPVGVGVSQPQVELRAAQLPAVEPAPQPTTVPVQPFAEVIATTVPQAVPPTPSTAVTTDTPPVSSDTPVAATTNSPVLGSSDATVLETAVPTATVTPDAVPPSTAAVEVVDSPATEGNELSAAVLAPVAQHAEPTPTVAPRGVTSAPPPVAAQLSDVFISHVRVVEKGGTHEFQMRLDPPELGEVKVRVLAMGDRVEAKLVVSDDAVRRLIESQLPELRQKLEAAGVSVPTFDVTTDSGGRANTGGDGWDRPQPWFVSPPKPADPIPRGVRPAPSGGVLDVTA